MRELSKKEVKQVRQALEAVLGQKLGISSLYEHVQGELIYYTQEPAKQVVAVAVHGAIFPALNLFWKLKIRPKTSYVVVDQGAVKPIVSGADILRPGIIEVHNIEKQKLCAVLEPERRVPIAVGLCLVSEEELKNMQRGKCIKNLHHLGDRLWKLDF
ncbi:MAG: hypothetical protein GXO42_03110 [bacterium]|nr:hypothetical protein [bacterium]